MRTSIWRFLEACVVFDPAAAALVFFLPAMSKAKPIMNVVAAGEPLASPP